MIIQLSEAAGNAILDVLAALMDGGSIELRSDAERVLAVLKLSDPATAPASGGVLEFNVIKENAALARGNIMAARILSSDGSEVFSCDVGDENSDAVIKLTGTTQIHRGQPVQLHSFKLAMP